MFKDRVEAGKLLAKALAKYKNEEVVILALPRGGVVIGYEIAKTLKSPLDIIVTRKIGHPDNREYAICVVNERGSLLCNETETRFVSQSWLKEETGHQQKEAERRVALYRGRQKPEKIKGRVAIIVDDGIATGFTMRLAIRSVKMQNPEKIIVAVPVAPFDSLEMLKNEGADEIIILEPPEEFAGAVGTHYIQFGQVEDKEVISLLQDVHK